MIPWMSDFADIYTIATGFETFLDFLRFTGVCLKEEILATLLLEENLVNVIQ